VLNVWVTELAWVDADQDYCCRVDGGKWGGQFELKINMI
jgi:hypothetical protein